MTGPVNIKLVGTRVKNMANLKEKKGICPNKYYKTLLGHCNLFHSIMGAWDYCHYKFFLVTFPSPHITVQVPWLKNCRIKYVVNLEELLEPSNVEAICKICLGQL